MSEINRQKTDPVPVRKTNGWRTALRHAITALLAGVSVVAILLTEYPAWVKIAGSAAFAVILLCYIFCAVLKKEVLARLSVTVIGIGAFFAISLWIFYMLGFFQYVRNKQTLKDYVASFGPFALVIFFIIQFMQVIFAPIPAPVTVAAGALLFDPFTAALVSFAAIVSASVVAFFIGKHLGKKVVKWIVGEEALHKGLELIKGKDKVAITLMFLFPFFPDDVLCFVAGLTTMSFSFFLIMNIVTRAIGIASTSLLTSFFASIWQNNLVLGIITAATAIAIFAVIFFVCMKHAESIDRFLSGWGRKQAKSIGTSVKSIGTDDDSTKNY